MLFAVCGDDPHEFAELCGLGSAAGLLTERVKLVGPSINCQSLRED